MILLGLNDIRSKVKANMKSYLSKLIFTLGISVTGSVRLSVSMWVSRAISSFTAGPIKKYYFHIWSGIVHEHIFLALGGARDPFSGVWRSVE